VKILKIVILCITLLLSAGCAQGLTELPLQTALVMADLGRSAEQVMRPTATPESEPTAQPQETPTAKDRFSIDADVMAQIRRRTTGATPQQTLSGECVYVRYDEAIEIAFWALDERADGNETLCGYGGLAQKIQDNRDILNLDNVFGIAAGTLGGDEAVTFYRNFATLLHRDAERTNGEAYRELMRSLSEGDTTQAIAGLNNILLGVDWWTTLAYGVGADQPAMLFINEEANDGPFMLFLGEDAVGDTQIVLAHVYMEADLDLVFDAFVRIIERVTDGEAPQVDLDLPEHACDYLDAEQAAVILGEDVEIVDELVDSCGYIPVGSLDQDEQGSFVGLSFHSGNDAADFVDSIIEDLIDQSRRLDRDVEKAVEAALVADDFGAALRLLPDLAVEPEALFFSARPDLSAGTIGVEWEMDDQSLRGLMTEGANGEIVFLLVTYVEMAEEGALLTAMDAFFADVIVEIGTP
jgi:hypothetical protein